MCPSGTTAVANGGAFRSAFDVLDADRDGKISRDDLRAFYSSAPAIREDDIGSMIAAADLDRDGYVEFQEFERILAGRRKAGEEKRAGDWMEEVFRAMDRDGDGRVGFEDLKGHLGAAGMPAGDEDVRAMIRVGGGGEGEGGGVSLEGLKRILAV